MTDAGATSLIDFYELGPEADRTLTALAGRSRQPIVLTNHFAFRAEAAYGEDDPDEPCSGVEAMLRYSAVSGDRLTAAGGRFLHQGFHTGALWGEDDSWDLVVVAEYPGTDALLTLLADATYREAYRHRRAAVQRRRVVASVPFG